MEKFTRLTAQAIPLRLDNVDTDMIIPAQFMTSVSREGYGQNLFRRLRDQDPQFPLNLDKYRNGKILIAQHNFGSGSSREHAVWALMGWGIRVVIAKSFADIFSGNCGKNGLVLVSLPEQQVEDLLSAAETGSLELSVDLEKQQVEQPEGTTLDFEYDSFRKHCILSGRDDVDYILSHQSDIAAYRQRQAEKVFFSVLTPNN